MGYKTTLDYTGLNTSTGTGIVRASDPDGNTTVYAYAQGALTAQSGWTGTTLTSEKDFGPNLNAGGSSGGTLLDSWAADGDGIITTSSYDASGNVTQITSPGAAGQPATSTSAFTSLDMLSCDATAEASNPCSSSNNGPSPVEDVLDRGEAA